MIAMLFSATVAFAVAIFGTAYAIRLFRAWNVGQFIQEELEGHMHKRGTPTMGGIVIILAVMAGYGASHLRSPGAGRRDRMGGERVPVQRLAGHGRDRRDGDRWIHR